MYFCAACLIGLRPLLSQAPRWIRINFRRSENEQGASAGSKAGGLLGGIALKNLRGKVPLKGKGSSDPGSVANVEPTGRNGEDGVDLPGRKGSRYDLKRFNEADQIRIQTDLEVIYTSDDGLNEERNPFDYNRDGKTVKTMDMV